MRMHPGGDALPQRGHVVVAVDADFGVTTAELRWRTSKCADRQYRERPVDGVRIGRLDQDAGVVLAGRRRRLRLADRDVARVDLIGALEDGDLVLTELHLHAVRVRRQLHVALTHPPGAPVRALRQQDAQPAVGSLLLDEKHLRDLLVGLFVQQPRVRDRLGGSRRRRAVVDPDLGHLRLGDEGVPLGEARGRRCRRRRPLCLPRIAAAPAADEADGDRHDEDDGRAEPRSRAHAVGTGRGIAWRFGMLRTPLLLLS